MIVLLNCFCFSYSQKIFIKATNDTIFDKVNIEVIVHNSTNRAIKLVPFPDRRWTFEITHKGHNYFEFKDIICAPYPDSHLKFKKIRNNYKFKLNIDFTKLNMELGYNDFIPDSVNKLDSIFSKYGYDKKVQVNQDFGTYKLMIEYMIIIQKRPI